LLNDACTKMHADVCMKCYVFDAGASFIN